MKTKIILTLIVFSVSFLLHGDGGYRVQAENAKKRIRFEITTIAESVNERRILSQTAVEGLPGTDFNINLQTGNFKMQTRFLSDLIAPDKLRIRANLDTRRFYGNSAANLPLYEEDSQKQSFEIGFDEAVILLPFGRNRTDETLKIEIVPTLIAVSDEETKRPLEINFKKQIPSGEISIEAFKIPHYFTVEAVLLENGKEIAAGKADCLFEEEKEIILEGKPNMDSETVDNSFAAKLRINKFNRSRPKDLVGTVFDIYQKKSSAENETVPIVNNASGINMLGESFIYKLENGNLKNGKNYEIKFNIRLAPGEQAD